MLSLVLHRGDCVRLGFQSLMIRCIKCLSIHLCWCSNWPIVARLKQEAWGKEVHTNHMFRHQHLTHWWHPAAFNRRALIDLQVIHLWRAAWSTRITRLHILDWILAKSFINQSPNVISPEISKICLHLHLVPFKLRPCAQFFPCYPNTLLSQYFQNCQCVNPWFVSLRETYLEIFLMISQTRLFLWKMKHMTEAFIKSSLQKQKVETKTSFSPSGSFKV